MASFKFTDGALTTWLSELVNQREYVAISIQKLEMFVT